MAETCIVFAGDSQFQLAASQLPLLATINPDITGPRRARVATTVAVSLAAGARPATVAVVTTPGALENHDVAINGTAIQDLNVSLITSFNPSTIVINSGTSNDMDSDPTIKGYIDTFLTNLRAVSSARVLWCEPAVPFGEQWTSGPPVDFTSVTASKIKDIGVQIATEAASYTNVIAIQMYQPCLAWEQINNTPPPGFPSGGLTLDGVHFNTTGATVIMEGQLLPYFV